jgi:hypothetical protein
MARWPAVQTMVTELGEERRCFDCGEWWPVDETFWYFDARGKVMGRCRACWVDFNRSRRSKAS